MVVVMVVVVSMNAEGVVKKSEVNRNRVKTGACDWTAIGQEVRGSGGKMQLKLKDRQGTSELL